jgi:hypothetical protein
LRLLLDEMYPPSLADALGKAGVEATTAVAARVAGRPDADVLDAAGAMGAVLLTENVADFAQLAAELVTAGRHHAGVLIALSSRFSRRPAGAPALVAAILAVADRQLDDLVLYLEPVDRG